MASNLGTYTLSSSIKTIVGTDYIGYAAITCLSGSVDVLATGKTINSWGANTAITLTKSQAVNVQSTLLGQPISGVSIDTTSGSAGVIIG